MIWVVLPAYNEAANLGSLLQRICDVQRIVGLSVVVLVVDDGSTDETVAVAEGFGGGLDVRVARNPHNMGLAETIKSGLARALELADDADLIVTMDADDTHNPGLIPRMLDRIIEGYDIVIASRFVPQARIRGLALSRQLLSLGASWLFRLLTPVQGVTDFTCGFRAYRAGFLREVWERHGVAITTASGFTCMADILLTCRRFDPIIAEVPLILRYDRKLSASKMKVQSTVLESLRLIARTRLTALEDLLRGDAGASRPLAPPPLPRSRPSQPADDHAHE